MSRKTVHFKTPSTVAKAADGWVTSRAEGSATVAETPEAAVVTAFPQQGVMRRFTIDVSDELHKRIKAQCALRGLKMADVLREILEREFPKA
jgi:hypothetical protein